MSQQEINAEFIDGFATVKHAIVNINTLLQANTDLNRVLTELVQALYREIEKSNPQALASIRRDFAERAAASTDEAEQALLKRCLGAIDSPQA